MAITIHYSIHISLKVMDVLPWFWCQYSFLRVKDSSYVIFETIEPSQLTFWRPFWKTMPQQYFMLYISLKVMDVLSWFWCQGVGFQGQGVQWCDFLEDITILVAILENLTATIVYISQKGMSVLSWLSCQSVCKFYAVGSGGSKGGGGRPQHAPPIFFR